MVQHRTGMRCMKSVTTSFMHRNAFWTTAGSVGPPIELWINDMIEGQPSASLCPADCARSCQLPAATAPGGSATECRDWGLHLEDVERAVQHT